MLCLLQEGATSRALVKALSEISRPVAFRFPPFRKRHHIIALRSMERSTPYSDQRRTTSSGRPKAMTTNSSQGAKTKRKERKRHSFISLCSV